MRIAAYWAGLTQERKHLRRTWLPSAQKGGFAHAHVFDEPEACRWILIQAARRILVDRPPVHARHVSASANRVSTGGARDVCPAGRLSEPMAGSAKPIARDATAGSALATARWS